MSKSGSLRGQDVRDAYRLIGQCRDMGHDPILWQQHLCDGLRRLVGCSAATGGEGVLGSADIAPVSSVESGLDAPGRRALAAYMRDGGPTIDPFISALSRLGGDSATRTRRQVVDDSAYYGSDAFQRYLQPANADHRLASVRQTTGGRAFSVMELHRPPRHRDFSAREQVLVGFFHSELGPLVGRALVSATEARVDHLSPRLRQTLECLMEGDGEKEAATRLGLSQTTLHEYVTALYRHFGVRSRGQLLAHMLKRSKRPASLAIPPRAMPAPGPAGPPSSRR